MKCRNNRRAAWREGVGVEFVRHQPEGDPGHQHGLIYGTLIATVRAPDHPGLRPDGPNGIEEAAQAVGGAQEHHARVEPPKIRVPPHHKPEVCGVWKFFRRNGSMQDGIGIE